MNDKELNNIGFYKNNHVYVNGYFLLGTMDDDVLEERYTLFDKITHTIYKVWTIKDIVSILEQIEKDSV